MALSCFQAEKTKNFVSRSLVIGEVLSIADMATAVKVRGSGRPALHELILSLEGQGAQWNHTGISLSIGIDACKMAHLTTHLPDFLFNHYIQPCACLFLAFLFVVLHCQMIIFICFNFRKSLIIIHDLLSSRKYDH